MTNLLCVLLPANRDDLYEELYAKATMERRNRADGYLRREDGLRCLAAGELLRRIVQQELGLSEFSVARDPDGKPRIAGQDTFHYNLSHSGNRVVIAWGDSPVGVDVQQMRKKMGWEKLAARYFTAQEWEFIFEDSELAEERFYRIWTAKESYLKYLGTGLSKSLSSFSVLSPEIAPMLKTKVLPDGYCITLCSEDADFTFELDIEDHPLG